jgi:choline dehydrogenase
MCVVDDSPILSELQAWFRIQISEPRFFYNITSVPQTSLRNRTFPILIGKVVGGSSAVNAMMAIRGSKQDYDQWGAFFGKSSAWTWKGMLPYFKKAVHFTPPPPALASTIAHDAALWGNTSGVHAAWPSFQYPATFAQVDTWRDMPGVDYRPDSGTGLPGLYWYPTFMDPTTATRSYARTGHWENARRHNYHLLTGSKVNKILLQGTKAYGVRFISAADGAGTTASIRANKEVILAAGALHTPQIMQLSGLGPRQLLASANIPVTVDLPGVGQNFQDHLSLSANFTCKYIFPAPQSAYVMSNR